MKVVYVAHCLGVEDRESNRAAASEWAGWIAKTFKVAISADWIVLSGVWSESPENRSMGLLADIELVRRADEVWCVGPRMSAGMRLETASARDSGKPVYDFTGLTREEIVAEISSLRGDA